MPRALGIDDAWAEEAQHLMSLSRTFDGFVEYAKRVSPTCTNPFGPQSSSVPASFANRPVSVRVYFERIVVAAEGQIICEHRRVPPTLNNARVRPPFSTGGTIWRSFSAIREPCVTVRPSPSCRLPSGPYSSACSSAPAATVRWSRSSPWYCNTTNRPSSPPSNWLWMLASVGEDPYPEPVATAWSTESRWTRLRWGQPPQALTLTKEPQANVERYDALRKAREARHAS